MEAGLEEERLQREHQETQRVSEAEARGQLARARTEVKAQERQAVQLESSCRAVERSLGQSGKRLQVWCTHTHTQRHTHTERQTHTHTQTHGQTQRHTRAWTDARMNMRWTVQYLTPNWGTRVYPGP